MPKEDENVEDQNVEETEEVDEDETDSDDNQEEPTIEELKAQIVEKDKALKKANAERTRLGKKLKAAPADDKDKEIPTLTDAAKRAFAIAELRAEGLNDAQAKRLAKLVNLDDIDLDEEGDVVGIDLDDIKEDFADLFNRSSDDGTAPKKNGGRKPATGDKSGSANPPSAQSDVTKQMLKVARLSSR